MKTRTHFVALMMMAGLAMMSCGAEVKIRISTRMPVKLNKEIHSASSIDMFFGKKWTPVDICAGPYYASIKALNLTSLHYPGGTDGNHYHVIPGDVKITGGAGDGYNHDLDELAERGRNVAQISGGVGTAKFGKDFFNEYCSLLEKLSIHGDVLAHVTTGFSAEEILWMIGRTHAKRVCYGTELNAKGWASDFPTAQLYIDRVSELIKTVRAQYPEMIHVIDVGPWHVKGKPRDAAWNEAIASQMTEGDEIRVYFWDRYLYAQVKAEDPTARLRECFDVVAPRWLDGFRERFPGKKVSVWQWGLKQGSMKPGENIYDTVFGCLHVAKMYHWMITYNRNHDNYIAYASYMNLKNLLRAGQVPPANHYHAMRLCGQLFEGTPDVLEAGITGTENVAVVCTASNGSYSMLCINANGHAVPVAGIDLDGAPAGTKKYRQESLYGDSFEARQITLETNESDTIMLKPYSVTMVRF